jgi:hypothetical protein
MLTLRTTNMSLAKPILPAVVCTLKESAEARGQASVPAIGFNPLRIRLDLTRNSVHSNVQNYR